MPHKMKIEKIVIYRRCSLFKTATGIFIISVIFMNPFLGTLSDAIALNADADTLMSTHLGLEKVGGHIYFFQFLI